MAKKSLTQPLADLKKKLKVSRNRTNRYPEGLSSLNSRLQSAHKAVHEFVNDKGLGHGLSILSAENHYRIATVVEQLDHSCEIASQLLTLVSSPKGEESC
ncbi:MAG: hypothetical protein K0R12_107 [Gammaproteobacteria bacterium]|jgi:hypothetical protein|nr:hypothetical protein [Gammaproteobacteria bacterium]